jgi:geranylgeranyl diphosphate synthase type I
MKYGVEKAINAGDALFSLAFMSMAKLEGAKCNVLELLGILSETCAKLTGGQDMDLDFEKGGEISLEAYLLMVQGKTASLFEACCRMGSLLGGGSPDDQISLSKFGKKLGMAFQIRDDWLGLWGDPEKTGKNRANDLLTAKWTFPILYTAQVDSSLVETLRAKRTKMNPQELIQKIANTGASEYTIQSMNKLLDEANSELDQLNNESEATSILRSLIENVRNL